MKNLKRKFYRWLLDYIESFDREKEFNQLMWYAFANGYLMGVNAGSKEVHHKYMEKLEKLSEDVKRL